MRTARRGGYLKNLTHRHLYAALCKSFEREERAGRGRMEDYNIKLNCQHADLPNVKQYIFICLAGRGEEAALSPRSKRSRRLTFPPP